jgi:hypothetical protein
MKSFRGVSTRIITDRVANNRLWEDARNASPNNPLEHVQEQVLKVFQDGDLPAKSEAVTMIRLLARGATLVSMDEVCAVLVETFRELFSQEQLKSIVTAQERFSELTAAERRLLIDYLMLLSGMVAVFRDAKSQEGKQMVLDACDGIKGTPLSKQMLTIVNFGFVQD